MWYVFSWHMTPLWEKPTVMTVGFATSRHACGAFLPWGDFPIAFIRSTFDAANPLYDTTCWDLHAESGRIERKYAPRGPENQEHKMRSERLERRPLARRSACLRTSTR